uniref:Ig-like domain-containing protein n=1 Tax=Cyprinodon variegatus TaxID=28743 RepID=A0A3Q2E6V9_CYPVA
LKIYISASMLEVTVRPGENITLYCDCKALTGVFIVWFFKNCSREEHSVPFLDQLAKEKKFPRLKFLKNNSSQSYDLLVMNVSSSDQGLYYCGTEKVQVEKDKNEKIIAKDVYTYGNITTRLTLSKQLYIYV